MKKKFKVKNEKLLFTILIITLFVILLLYYNLIFSVVLARNAFANQLIEIASENENPIFTVQKVLLYSSANAIDNSEDQSLKDMSICQFSDISIYIDNTSTIPELTDENTIKQLYIDNIVATTSNENIGTKTVNYKKTIEKPENDRIDFNIVNTNVANENNDYSSPTFYTDCSNPICLGYMNQDILTNYSVSESSSSVSFNGKVLQQANINLDDINYTLSFQIHIINNLNQKFVYHMSLNVNLNDDNGGIYNGYVYKSTNTSGNEYRFFKEGIS